MSWHNRLARRLRSVCHDPRRGQFGRSAADLVSSIVRPLAAALVPSGRLTVSGREPWAADRRLRVERLEPRLVLTPLVIDLGSDTRIQGLGRPDDDTVVLIGNSNYDPQQNENAPRLITLSLTDSTFSIGPLSAPGTDSFVWRVSPNGEYIAGFSYTVDSIGFGEGVVWNRTDLSNPDTVGHLGTTNQSVAIDVSNNGVAVGDADGGRKAFRWNETEGIVELAPGPIGVNAGIGVSANGNVVSGFGLNGIGQAQAAVWDENGHTFLDDEFRLGSRADVVSPNGRIIGGHTSEFDLTVFETFVYPAVWIDHELTIIPDSNGDNFVGNVKGVADNGYVVGTTVNNIHSQTDQGYIWHPDFPNGARLFDEWLATEYGVTLPHSSASVMDVVLYNNALNFAVDACPPTSSPDYESCTGGSQYFVSVPLGTPPRIVDLSAEADNVVGVAALPNGTTLLVGNVIDPATSDSEAFLYTVSPDGSTTTTQLGSLGGSTTVTGISHNGRYISGYSVSPLSQGLGEGTVWMTDDPVNPHGVGFLGSFNQSPAFDISNSGVAVGHADGALQAFRWTPSDGIQAISAPSTAEGAVTISDLNNTVAGAAVNNVGTSQAAVWNDNVFEFLEDPFQISSISNDVSPDGRMIGGRVGEFDFAAARTIQHAAIWEDGSLRTFTDRNGDPFEGEVLAVTNNGYAVGQTPDDRGFIWHESFVNSAPMLFDDWLAAEFGTTLPTPSTAVNDVVWDGAKLHFAVGGSAYAVSTDVPDSRVTFVDLSDEADNLTGVTRLPDGTTLVVGNSAPALEDSEAILFTITADASSITSTPLASLGGSTTARAISDNGQYIAGYSVSPLSVSFGEGAVWDRSDPQNPTGVGFLGSFQDSPLLDISNAGTATGAADGFRQAITWSEAGGVQALSHVDGTPFGAGGAISNDGTVIVGLSFDTADSGRATIWDHAEGEFLEDPFPANSFAAGLSPNGRIAGGTASTFDFNTFETTSHAALWIDRELRYLTDPDGEPFQGIVRAVTDNGYAVGDTNFLLADTSDAFIWHESFPNAGVMLFDDWLLAEYGVGLPTPTMSVADVMFDGKALNFAVNGSAYFVRTVIDAAPGFTVTESDAATVVDESGSTDTFTVMLNAAPASDVTINIASENTAEVIVDPASLTFTPENWDQPQTVTATGQDDDDPDGDTTTVVRLSIDDNNSDDAFDMLLDRRVIVTTTDNEVTSAHPWQNISNPLDVDNDSDVSPIDALLVFNVLNKSGSHELPAGGPSSTNGPFVDVNGDDFVSPVDALVVINFLNKVFVQGEAEARLVPPGPRHGAPSRAEVASAAQPLPKADNNFYVRGPVGSLRDRPAPSEARRHLFATLSEADAFWNESAVDSLTDWLATEIAVTNCAEA